MQNLLNDNVASCFNMKIFILNCFSKHSYVSRIHSLQFCIKTDLGKSHAIYPGMTSTSAETTPTPLLRHIHCGMYT